MIVKAHPWEKSIRVDCAIGPARLDKKISIFCADGENLVLPRGSLVFSATDGTVIAFVSGRGPDGSEVTSVVSIGTALRNAMRSR
jgi:hypothetical protein